MIYRHVIDATAYVFDDLRDLLAKATPPRSGDRLAGLSADSAEHMIAARMALADVPLTQFLQETVIAYEDDEVTRLIKDQIDRVKRSIAHHHCVFRFGRPTIDTLEVGIDEIELPGGVDRGTGRGVDRLAVRRGDRAGDRSALHAGDAGSAAAMRTGLRVRPRWAAEVR